METKEITKKCIGAIDGRPVTGYQLTNNNGMSVEVADYGAIMLKLCLNGTDVTLGHLAIEDYKINKGHLGSIVAPNANRIARGEVSIEGKLYQLQKNDHGINNLHTHTTDVSDKKFLTAGIEGNRLQLSCDFADGEAGLPGNRHFTVEYELNDDNQLILTYQMSTDKTTLFNPTCHSYFNLAGHDSGSVFDHLLKLEADNFTPVDELSIPTGEIRPVAGTPFDFRQFKPVGRDFSLEDRQLGYTQGYDHNWVINDYDGSLRLFAQLVDPHSGRRMRCYTTMPGVQFYSANYLNDDRAKDGGAYRAHDGLCLETQFYPDSIHHENFPQPLLKAGETGCYRTVYEFEF